MSSRKEILDTFVDRLVLIFPELVAVYEFNKELTLFDKILKCRKGLVVIVPEEDYSLENLLLVDLVYDKIQDEFGWVEAVKLANSFSRSYIRTKSNLWHINIKNNHCLLPEDQINLKNTRRLIYGTDIVPIIPFPHNEEEIKQINIGFSRGDALKIKDKFSKYFPLANPDCCWMRFDFSVNHSIIHIIHHYLTRIRNGIQPEKHVHIYGRYGGSGKTQLSYSLMKKCKELSLPFLYRTEFWKGSDGKYIDDDFNPDNSAESVADWVVEKSPGNNFVLFLDEVNIDLDLVRKKLSEKYSNEKVNFLIISAGKDLPPYVDENFDVFDISKEYTFTESQYQELINHLLQLSNIPEDVFSKDILDYIVKHTRLWNLSSIRNTPTSVILTCSMALAETLYQSGKENIQVNRETAEKWSFLGTSPWFQKYNELHDVHAEYLIFNGKEYEDVDKYYHHPLP